MCANDNLLNRIFTPSFFKKSVLSKKNEWIIYMNAKYSELANSKNYEELFVNIYKILKKKYRNEYFYKNTLLNKLLLGIHSPKTTTALAEIPISKSKADFILINGKAIVYEIKTELDTFERLNEQIYNYYKAFDHVCVLTSEKNEKEIKIKLNNDHVGIYLLTKKNTIKRLREPLQKCDQLDKNEIFKILNKKEFENILLNKFGELPTVSDFKYYKECKNKFSELDLNVIYKLFLNELKKRNSIDITMYNKIPYELKTVVYFLKDKKYYNKIENLLNMPIGG